MSDVYKARDHKLNRYVAIKVLKAEFRGDREFVSKFRVEAQAAAGLAHPNIVNVFDVGEENGNYFIVMELVEGITLKLYIQNRGRLSVREAVGISLQVAAGLEAAHNNGIIHRDVKPQNIIISTDGTAKVADFGIAKLPNAETLTMTDKAIGTVFYISPEQASGKPIDRRSDLYSLGVTMYEMATGKLPFMADSPVTVALMQVKNKPRAPREINASLPIGLEQIIMGAMEKNPDNRFQSAAQMLRHVAQVKSNPRTIFKMPRHDTTGEHAVVTGPATPPNVQKLTPPRRASRSMFPVIAGVATAFLIVCCISAVVVLTKLFEATTTDNSIHLEIPDFVGQIYSEGLEENLEKQYYNVEVEYKYDDAYDRNVILAQDPLPEEKRKVIPGKQMCELKLTVCWGAETCEVPDLVYEDSRDAVIALRDLGLIPEEFKMNDEYVIEGCVIRTDPIAGTTLKRGDTVYVYVSSGQSVEYVEVPDFLKCDEQAVMKMLGWSSLELGEVTREYSDTVNKGCVISQSKAISAQVPKGTKINFVMSLGPKPAETTAPETTDSKPADTTKPQDTTKPADTTAAADSPTKPSGKDPSSIKVTPA
jgi:serine/threonine-protein kinase